MTKEKLDVDAILAAVGADREARAPEASEDGAALAAALEAAVTSLRQEELVEVEEENLAALMAEVAEAGLDARSPKQLMKRVVRTLVHSDHVEEVYGTDDMLIDALKRFLDPQ